MNQNLLKLLEKKAISLHLLLSVSALLFMTIIGVLDYFVPSIDLFIFYSLVVVFSALFLSYFEGIVASTVCSIWSFLTNLKYLTYESTGILYFNLFLDFSVFILIVALVIQLKKSFLKEKDLARLDYLTGLGNRRAFIENLTNRNNSFEKEFSVSYIDIDNFYNFIEMFGLIDSDRMIKNVALFLKKHYREIYRYDENRFIIISDEKEGQKTALTKMNLLRTELQKELFKLKFPVTLSIGIAFISQKSAKISNIILNLFKLVHSIKKEGGNQIKYTIIND